MASNKANVFIDNSPSIDQTAGARPFAPPPPTMDSVIDDAGDLMGTLASGGVTDDRQPEFQGRGTPGDTILIRDHGVEIGETVVDEDGQWTFTPSTDMSEGHHAITIVARDPAGDESEPSGPFHFEIDVTPPDASKLSITGVLDTVGGITGNVATGKTTDDARPLLTGTSTGQPGHTVTVMVRDSTGTHALGEAVVGDNGQWSLQVISPLAAGLNTFTLVEKDVAGNETAPTGRYQVIIDTSKPAPPVIEHVYDDVGMPHMLAPGEVTNDARPTLHGTAQPGHTVTFHDGTTVLGTTQTRADGTWEFTPKDNLSEGAHHITATATGPVGQTGDASSGWHFEVDTLAPTQTSTVSGIGKDSGMNADDHATNDGSAGRLMTGRLSASLAAGETLQVSTDGGQTWKTAFVSGTQWSAQDDHSHAGDWTVQTRVVDLAGNVGPVSSQAVTLDTATPHAPTAVALGNGQVTVSFDKAAVSPGDRIHLLNGNQNVDYLLTAADMAAGQATIAVGDVSLNLAAAVVSATGNHSLYMVIRSNADREDFDAGEAVELAPGQTADAGALLLTRKDAAADAASSNNGVFDSASPDHGQAWHISGTTRASLKGNTYNAIEFDWRHSQTTQSVTFYDASGKVIFEGTFGQDHSLPADGHSKFIMPDGLSFASFDIRTGRVDGIDTDWIEVDNVSLAVLYPHPELVGIPTLQEIQAGSDVHYGGAGDDVFLLPDVSYFEGSHAKVIGNEGLDTLTLTGADQTLDLTTATGKLSGVEIIDITGTGDNTLKLSLADVMENGALDQFVTDGRVQMMVKGDTGDTVTLSDALPNGTDPGDWVRGADVTLDDVVYEAYTHSGFDAALLVQQGVTVNVQNTAGTFSEAGPGADAHPVDAASPFTDSDEAHIARFGYADRQENDAGDDAVRIHGDGDFGRVHGALGVGTLVMDGKAMHIDLSALDLKTGPSDSTVQMQATGDGDGGGAHGSDAAVSGITDHVYSDLAGTALLVEDKVHVTIL
ncbi:MAG: Ig-like domain-containing protein [Pseudomonadota bacterium]